MGSCFLVNGMRYSQSRFSAFATNTITSLTLFGLCCLFIPSTLSMLIEAHDPIDGDDLTLNISHGIATMLLVFYVLYLFFELRTHSELFDSQGSEEDISAEGDTSADSAGFSLGPRAATIWLAVSLTCVTLCTVPLISSIQGSTWKANNSFLGFILFPFLGNVTDYLSALVVALKGEMDIVILVTIGSGMQLLFFTLPILVILGWILNEPLTLDLDIFVIGTVFLGVFVVSYVVAGGRSNYLSGAMCLAL